MTTSPASACRRACTSTPQAESANGWNRWGAEVKQFAREVAEVRVVTDRLNADPSNFTMSWGGLVVLAADDDAAREKATQLGAGASTIVGGPQTVSSAIARYRDAGAEWVILGPVDSSNPDNAARIGDEVLRRVR